MFGRRSNCAWIGYTLFAAYVMVVILFLASLLLRPAPKKMNLGKGLPKYMEDSEIMAVKIKTDEPMQQQLKHAFDKSDRNQNGYVEEQELFNWIQSKISEHITVAIKNNFRVFLRLDNNPKDGWISLPEYEAYFFSTRDVTEYEGLSAPAKEQLRLEQEEFLEVGNMEDKLTIDELLRFLHPETSHSKMLERTDQLIDTLDQDGDGAVSPEELLQLSDPVYQPSDEEAAIFPVDSETQMRALHTELDGDGDHVLLQHELLMFVDPRHSYHVTRETRRLLRLGDRSGDGRLTLDEVQAHAHEFRLMADARHKFHEEEDLR